MSIKKGYLLVLCVSIIFCSCNQKSQDVTYSEPKMLKENSELLFSSLDMEGMGGFESSIVELSNLPASEVSVIEPSYPELTYCAYRIKKGDMISVLAENYGVTQDTLISVNSIKQSRLIQIGQYIRIPSIPGILYSTRMAEETPESIAEKYEVSLEKLVAVNNLEVGVALSEGTALFVPDAVLDWVTRQEINGDLFKRPLRGTYYFTSWFGWRNSPFTGARTYHNGIDMASYEGKSIYAALAGTVTTAGWSNTYGNYVIVTHHSGYKTLYGHMSQILVTKGQWVSTDTVLGKVGNTGLSTGPHLHFTVFKNGVAINPSNLWN